MAGAWEEGISQVLMRYGVTKEPLQGNAAEELENALQDYHGLARQYGQMLADFCHEDRPVRKDGIWLCPKCRRRIQHSHSHCHRCGKKIGWAAGRRGQEKPGKAHGRETGYGREDRGSH